MDYFANRLVRERETTLDRKLVFQCILLSAKKRIHGRESLELMIERRGRAVLPVILSYICYRQSVKKAFQEIPQNVRRFMKWRKAVGNTRNAYIFFLGNTSIAWKIVLEFSQFA